VHSKGLNDITSSKVAEQIMDNSLRIADASSRGPSNLGKDLATAQPTADGQCKSHAKSCPSQFLETNVRKHHSKQILENQENQLTW